MTPEPLGIGLVVREEERHLAIHEQITIAKIRVTRQNVRNAAFGLDRSHAGLRFRWPPTPGVTKPNGRKYVQRCSLRAAVPCSNLNEDVFGRALSVLDEDVKITVVVKNAGVEKFIFGLLPRTASILCNQIVIGISALRIFVEILHVGVRGGTIEVEIIFLYVLAVIPFTVGQAKEAFLQDGVGTVPQCEGEAEFLFFIRNSSETVFAPVVGARASLVMREVIPRGTIGAVILSNRSPLTLAQVWTPLFPWSNSL